MSRVKSAIALENKIAELEMKKSEIESEIASIREEFKKAADAKREKMLGLAGTVYAEFEGMGVPPRTFHRIDSVEIVSPNLYGFAGTTVRVSPGGGFSICGWKTAREDHPTFGCYEITDEEFGKAFSRAADMVDDYRKTVRNHNKE